jgi:hypothetical protein
MVTKTHLAGRAGPLRELIFVGLIVPENFLAVLE